MIASVHPLKRNSFREAAPNLALGIQPVNMSIGATWKNNTQAVR
jgi:hypothetical protein